MMNKNRLITCALLFATTIVTSAQTTDGRTFDPPVMGWSSWNTFAADVTEEVVKGQADAMVSNGLLDVGYNYINIDDGFQYDRDSTGRLQVNPTRFPNGMKVVVDYIHDKGLKAGIYSDAGHSTCANYYGGEENETVSGMLDHDDDDCDLFFNEWEFDFIKVDFCGGTSWQNNEGLDLDPEERYKAIAEAIARTGRQVNYNVCRWDFPGTWVCDIADSWRTTQDINASWESVKDIINQNLYLSAYCGGGHYNDLDMLEVGRGLSQTEDRTHFGMWCILSSPLLIGCDLRDLSSSTLSLLKNTELIALNQDSLGLQAYVVKSQDSCYVLTKDVETRHGLKRAVAFYNPTDSRHTVSITFGELDLAGEVKIRNAMSKTDVTNSDTDGFSVSVAAHGANIYVFSAESRTDRTLYEAETAYLGAYQELTNNQSAQTAIYSSESTCSGGMKAGWLGMSDANDLQWNDVYVSQAGDYQLTISYISGESRNIYVDVNGEQVSTLTCNSGGWSTVKDTNVTVHLNEGSNTVRLYNASAWMPDIDCMTVTLLQTDAIARTETDGADTSSSIVTDIQGRIVSRNGQLDKLPSGGPYIINNKKFLKK